MLLHRENTVSRVKRDVNARRAGHDVNAINLSGFSFFTCNQLKSVFTPVLVSLCVKQANSTPFGIAKSLCATPRLAPSLFPRFTQFAGYFKKLLKTA